MTLSFHTLVQSLLGLEGFPRRICQSWGALPILMDDTATKNTLVEQAHGSPSKEEETQRQTRVQEAHRQILIEGEEAPGQSPVEEAHRQTLVEETYGQTSLVDAKGDTPLDDTHD